MMLSSGVKDKPDVHALASIDAHSAAVLVSNYHDSSKAGPPAEIDLVISSLPQGRALVEHFRVDDEHSNAYEVWKKMGSPQQPSPAQYAELEAAGQLQPLTSPRWVRTGEGRLRIPFTLPLHGVSLIRITW